MKSSKVEVQKRVEEVFKLRLGGAEFADIVQFASAPEQNWSVAARQIWNYIAAADKLVKQRFDARAEHLLNRHLLQRRTLYAHALGAGDFRTALAVLQDEAKLEGLYPATKTELTGKSGGPIRFALEDLAAAERELEEWERERGTSEPEAPAGHDGQPQRLA
jgi:hypothetical protein